ncbi:MAG: S-layer homology domain-containing protein, partial [Cellulosilyticaceae bacterium]
MRINIKKKLALIVAIIMMITNFVQVTHASNYATDDASDYFNHWSKEVFQKLANKGILKKDDKGMFRPKDLMSRAEFAESFVHVYGYTDMDNAKEYIDVDEETQYVDDIKKLSSASIMYEDGDAFRPNDMITREEAVYAIANAYQVSGHTENIFKDESSISPWALDAVQAMHSHNYVQGTPRGKFYPQKNLTRAEFITIINNIMNDRVIIDGIYTQDVDGNLIINTESIFLENMTIKDDLYIGEGNQYGTIEIDNITVDGNVFIQGEGLSSIVSKNSKYNEKMFVSATKPIKITIDGEPVDIEILPRTKVTLTGNFKEVIVTDETKIDIKNARIGKIIVLPAKDGNTDVTNIPIINIDASSKVECIVADTEVEIKGEGTVDRLEVNSSDVKIEQIPGEIKILKNDITVNVGGNDIRQDVEEEKKEEEKKEEEKIEDKEEEKKEDEKVEDKEEEKKEEEKKEDEKVEDKEEEKKEEEKVEDKEEEKKDEEKKEDEKVEDKEEEKKEDEKVEDKEEEKKEDEKVEDKEEEKKEDEKVEDKEEEKKEDEKV